MGNEQALAATANTRNLSTSLPISPRLKALGAILTKTYVCARQPLPKEEVLAFQAQCFDEALTAAGVPTDDLDEVYRRAIAVHTSAFPIGTGELITAWHAVQADRREAARAETQRAWMAEYEAREQAHREHIQRLNTDPEYKATHEAQMADITRMRHALRNRVFAHQEGATDAIASE